MEPQALKRINVADWTRDTIATIIFTISFVGIAVLVLSLNAPLIESSETVSPLTNYQREIKNEFQSPQTTKFPNTTNYESQALTCMKNNCVWSGGICDCSKVKGASIERNHFKLFLEALLRLK